MPAQTVLEELTQDEMTKDHVERRVEDWVERVEQLYRDIEGWLPEGLTARKGGKVQMDEEVMRRAGVAPRQMPTLKLVHEHAVGIEFIPYGLWIIGVNGRVDIFKGDEHYILFDRSKSFERPNWRIAAATSRRDVEPFDAARFHSLLS